MQLIARDRASEYAEAAARAAPNALQVADRFHLMQNVREMLQRLLERHQAALRAATANGAKLEADTSQLPTTSTEQDQGSLCACSGPGPGSGYASLSTPDRVVAPDADKAEANEGYPHCSANEEVEDPTTSCSCEPSGLSSADQRRHVRRAKRLELYQTVQRLHSAGYSQRDIAKQLRLGRHSVRRFVIAMEFPERGTRRAVPSILDPFIPYLHEQMSAGQDNGLQLWREIRDQQDYRGSRALVARWVARHRHLCPLPDPAQEKRHRRGASAKQAKLTKSAKSPASEPRQERRRCSARQAAFLLVRREEELEPDDQALLERLCAQEPELQVARKLSGEFLMMIRERKGERLDDWLRRAEESRIAEIGNFVKGIQRDKAAVLPGLTLEDSSGQVEGQVNRLKFIKRAGYGRAKFDLLRRRVLATRAPPPLHVKCG